MATYSGEIKYILRVKFQLERSDEKKAKRLLESLRVNLEETYGDLVQVEVLAPVLFSGKTLLLSA
jgi:hypothetical protein